MEFLFAIGLVVLASVGLGVGLLFGRAPVRTSCGAADKLSVGRCSDCPLRRARADVGGNP